MPNNSSENKTESTSEVQHKRILLSEYTAPAYSIINTKLHFLLNETNTMVTSLIHFKKNDTTGLQNNDLTLNGVNLKLITLKINGNALQNKDYKIENEFLTLFNPPSEFEFEALVEINPQANKSCEGLYLSNGIFATQCEAESFRKITYFLDRPDVMTSYTVTLQADKTKYPLLLSNGDCIAKKDLDNNQHMATWKDPFKKPSYLFALVAGDLGVVEDQFITRSGKKVKLEVFASYGKQNRCLFAMEALKKSMKWDEERYGLEYDLNQFMIVSIDDFNMGAMENKGLNIFNSRLVLADPASATDADFDRIESVVGHEYFHNWSGNRVTCRNWFELSLKEGLTVFRDQEFSADMSSAAVQRIKDVDRLRMMQFSEDAGPNSHPVRPESCLAVDNFYTPTIYEKGAEIIRMMQTLVGKAGFRKGMDEYFKRHDGQAVTIIDFANSISESNNIDFSQFKLWYSQSGTPIVTVTELFKQDFTEYHLTLKQSYSITDKQKNKKPFHIPLRIGLLGQNGNLLKLDCKEIVYNSDEQAILNLTKESQTFVFKNITEKPTLSLNQNFSAPIKLDWSPSKEDLLNLIKHDTDAFNRREALYKMNLDSLKNLIQNFKDKNELQFDPQLIEAYSFVIKDKKIDSQFKALMLQFPDIEILAQEETILDAQAFKEVYSFFYKTLVQTFTFELLNLYTTHHPLQTIGDRALKNQILSLLILGNHENAIHLASDQFNKSLNMTEKLNALSFLCQSESQEKEKALDNFYNEWQQDAVVFNKWLQVQAGSWTNSTFNTVKGLTQKPQFKMDNPNNIYSLIGVFADNHIGMQKNYLETYPWLCQIILKVDQLNPQVAARLCGSFNFVNKLPEKIKSVAIAELKNLLSNEKLSRNSRELLESSL